MSLGTLQFYNSTRGGDNVQSITSSSFTPDANSILVIAANHTIKVGADNTANVTISNTGGLTFTKLEHHSWAPISYGANLNIWYCEVGSSPSSMTVTVAQATVDPSYGSSIDIFSWTGYVTGSAFGLVEKFNRGTGYPNFTTGDGVWNLTLATAPASTSELVAVLVVDAVGSTTVSPGSGWTEIADPGSVEAQQVQVRRGSTSTAVAWADTCVNIAGAYVNLAIIFEVKEASSSVTGTSVKTNSNDTSVVTGRQPVQAASVKTNGNDSSVVTGRQPVQAASVKTNGSDSSAIQGTVGSITGTSVATNGNDSSAVTGRQPVRAASVKTNGNDSSVVTGRQPVQAASVKTNGNDTSVIQGTVGSTNVTGTSVAINRNDSSAITGHQPVRAASVRTERPDSSAVTGAPATQAASVAQERRDSSNIQVTVSVPPQAYGFVGFGKTKTKEEEDEDLKTERIRRGIIPPDLKPVMELGSAKPVAKPATQVPVSRPTTVIRDRTEVYAKPAADIYAQHKQGLEHFRQRRKADDEKALKLILELV